MQQNSEILEGEAIERVVAFEHQLFNLSLDPQQYSAAAAHKQTKEADGTPLETIEDVWKKKIVSYNFGANYFLTEAGREAWAEATGIELKAELPESIIEELSIADLSGIDSKALDKLEADSVGYEEKRLTEAFIKNGFRGENIPSPDILVAYKNPQMILEKARGYRGLKTYVKKAAADLQRVLDAADANGQAGAKPELEAKLLIANLYRQRLNKLLASSYVEAYKFLCQRRRSNSYIHQEITKDLHGELPGFYDTAKFIAENLQMVDRYRHGASRDENGKYTWSSKQAAELAKEAEATKRQGDPVDRGVYGNIDMQELNEVEIDSEEYGEWLSYVLQEYGLLSEFTEWDSEREEPAPDDKWQVIVSDTFKHLSVTDNQKIVAVPAETRSLFSALTLANHEITHVLQKHNKRAIGQLAIMNAVGFDVASEQAESGAKWQEKAAHGILTGFADTRIAGTGYYEATRVKERGGSFGECVEVFFKDLQKRNPEESPETLAARAVNRIRRVFGNGGFEFAKDREIVTNTQPLSYLEQELIYSSLAEEQRRLLFIGGVTLSNLVKLSQNGLVDFRKITIPVKMPLDLLFQKVKEKLEISNKKW